MTIKSYAKVNIYLKIIGFRGNYHELHSRFIKVKSLYDTLSFEPKQKNDTFVIEGNFSCETQQNSIYKVYIQLKNSLNDPRVNTFFDTHKVVVEKHIPEFAGLGGGSSNAAAFLNLLNHTLDLKLSKVFLADIGSRVGADIPFFVYNYDSANVSGIGEKVEEYQEDIPHILTHTPPIKCSTQLVYETFRKSIQGKEDLHFIQAKKDVATWKNLPSANILNTHSAQELNDLYLPAVHLYKDLTSTKHPYFSGSGSSFFKKETY